ncbi:MAG: hypothetical protein RR057_05505 [Clostridia bacterium]
MSFVTPKMIEKAKEMDLFTYLQNYEPHELVRFSGNTYTTKTHDSLKISNGKWMCVVKSNMHWIRGIGGKSALDYLVKVKGFEFTQAVETLIGNVRLNSPNIIKQHIEPKPEKLLLPDKNSNSDKVIEYLFHRGIDYEIINYCLQKG